MLLLWETYEGVTAVVENINFQFNFQYNFLFQESQTVDDDIEDLGTLEGEQSETIASAASAEQDTPRRVSPPVSTSTRENRIGNKPLGRKRRIEELNHAVKDLRAASEVLAKPVDETGDDEIEVFGKYVAKTLKKLSSYDSICAQQDIQGVLTKYRLGSRPMSAASNVYSPDTMLPSPQNTNIYVAEPSGLLSLATIVTDSLNMDQ